MEILIALFVIALLIIIIVFSPVLFSTLIVVGVLLYFVISLANLPPSILNGGYLDDDNGYKLQRNIINIFRVQIGKLPIWLTPAKWIINTAEKKLLEKANLLFYETKNSINRSPFPSDTKASLLYQCALIPQNIANGLWKLSYLRRLASTTKGMSITKQHEMENTKLQKQIIHEMESLIQKLSFLSLSLLKSEISRDNKTIEEFLFELSNNNIRLQNIIPSDNFTFNRIEKTSSTYYIVTFVILAITFTVISIYAPAYSLPTIIIGSLLGFVAIGVFQLRNDKNIKDESFTKIIIELLKSIGLVK